MSVSVADIKRARTRLEGESVVQKTPIDSSRSLSRKTGGTVQLKMEHLQRTGSFKTRGAYNKLQKIATEANSIDKVVAASAGNHAQGVALAAAQTNLASTIVMPKTTPQAKISATKGFGAEVELRGHDFQEALNYARSLVADNDVFVHAYDDPDIIAGQGTIGLEILEQVPQVDIVLVPIGGGGLIGGIGTAIDTLAPEVDIIGIQTKGAATVPQSLEKGSPIVRDSVQTLADGIATGGTSDITYELIERHVDDVITVSETEVAEAILFLLERTKQMVEGAAATSVAPLLSGSLNVEDRTAVPLLSGGNLGLVELQTVLTNGLAHREQLIQLRIQIVDEPGELAGISGIISNHGANVKSVRHERAVKGLGVEEAFLDFRIETSGSGHSSRIIKTLEDEGYNVSQQS